MPPEDLSINQIFHEFIAALNKRLDDHDLLVEIKTLVAQNKEIHEDHEKRLRVIERSGWKFSGGIAVISAFLTSSLIYVMQKLFSH